MHTTRHRMLLLLPFYSFLVWIQVWSVVTHVDTVTAGKMCEASCVCMCLLYYVSGCIRCVSPPSCDLREVIQACVCGLVWLFVFWKLPPKLCVFDCHHRHIVMEKLSIQWWQNKQRPLDRQESQHRRKVPSETEYVGALVCVITCITPHNKEVGIIAVAPYSLNLEIFWSYSTSNISIYLCFCTYWESQVCIITCNKIWVLICWNK